VNAPAVVVDTRAHTDVPGPHTCDPVSPSTELCGKHFPIWTRRAAFCRGTVPSGRITVVHINRHTCSPWKRAVPFDSIVKSHVHAAIGGLLLHGAMYSGDQNFTPR